MSRHRAHRLWRLAGLQFPPTAAPSGSNIRGRDRCRPSAPTTFGRTTSYSTRAPMARAEVPHGDRRIHPRCLAIDVAGGIRSGRVIEMLNSLISERGAPRSCAPTMARSSSAKRSSSGSNRRGRDRIDRSGQAMAERCRRELQRQFRDECLSMEWFRSRREAKVVIEVWRRHYNAVRPHSSLDYRTPIEFRQHHEFINQGAALK